MEFDNSTNTTTSAASEAPVLVDVALVPAVFFTVAALGCCLHLAQVLPVLRPWRRQLSQGFDLIHSIYYQCFLDVCLVCLGLAFSQGRLLFFGYHWFLERGLMVEPSMCVTLILCIGAYTSLAALVMSLVLKNPQGFKAVCLRKPIFLVMPCLTEASRDGKDHVRVQPSQEPPEPSALSEDPEILSIRLKAWNVYMDISQPCFVPIVHMAGLMVLVYAYLKHLRETPFAVTEDSCRFWSWAVVLKMTIISQFKKLFTDEKDFWTQIRSLASGEQVVVQLPQDLLAMASKWIIYGRAFMSACANFFVPGILVWSIPLVLMQAPDPWTFVQLAVVTAYIPQLDDLPQDVEFEFKVLRSKGEGGDDRGEDPREQPEGLAPVTIGKASSPSSSGEKKRTVKVRAAAEEASPPRVNVTELGVTAEQVEALQQRVCQLEESQKEHERLKEEVEELRGLVKGLLRQQSLDRAFAVLDAPAAEAPHTARLSSGPDLD